MKPDELTKDDLVRHISEMNAEILTLRDQLRQSRDESDWTTDAMKARTRVLNERVKELGCVYQMFHIFRSPQFTFEQKAGRITDLLPRAWQHPESACARTLLRGQEFRTTRYRTTPWSQNEPIAVDGEVIGSVEVCYLHERPAADEGPFLREERMLLKVAAECLGAICQMHRAL